MGGFVFITPYGVPLARLIFQCHRNKKTVDGYDKFAMHLGHEFQELVSSYDDIREMVGSIAPQSRCIEIDRMSRSDIIQEN
jgi:hypothetical protein